MHYAYTKYHVFLGEKFHLCNKLLFMDTLKSFEAQFKDRCKLVKFVKRPPPALVDKHRPKLV